MTFLKKFGAALVKGLAVVAGFEPTVNGLIGGLAPQAAGIVAQAESELSQISSVVGNVEAIGQALALTGAQKLTAAAIPVEQIILSASFMTGKNIKDETKFKAAVSAIASGFADLLNSLD